MEGKVGCALWTMDETRIDRGYIIVTNTHRPQTACIDILIHTRIPHRGTDYAQPY